MSDPTVIVTGADTWVNSQKAGERYGDTNAVWVKQGTRRGLVRPSLPNLAGQTVTSAILYGTAGPGGFAAQEFSLAPLVGHFAQGRVTWNNQPDVDSGAYVFSSPGAVPEGGKVAFNVGAHLQAVADGEAEYEGWRLGTDNATGGRFVSFDSGEPAWELHITLASDADTPTNLRPDGGAVGSGAPILAWDYEDQAASRVQVDTPAAGAEPDEVAPDYDSGWQANITGQWGAGSGGGEVVTNLATNPSYEATEEWVAVTGSSEPVRSTEQAWAGSWSVKFARGTGTGVPIGRRSNLTNLLPGAGTYTLSPRMWVPSLITGNAGIRVTGTGTALTTGYVTERDGWAEVVVTFTWDGVGSAILDVVDEAITPGAYAYLDALIPVAGSEPVPYFDGDTPDTPEYVYAWTGTPGASTSTRTSVATPGYPVRVGEGPHYWRVAVRDTDGTESEWSDWAEFTVTPHPALIVDAPTGTVGDPAVTVLAHLASGNIGSWYVWATGPDRSDVRWRSGAQTGPIDVQVPAKNKDKRRLFTESDGGWLYVWAQDDEDRAVAVGESNFVDAWIPVTFSEDFTIPEPSGLFVTQFADGDPRLVWRFTLGDLPDEVLLKVDGDTAIRVPGADLTVIGAGVFEWVDSGEVSPLRPHTLGVAAVPTAGGKASNQAKVLDHSHVVEGVWLLPEADIDPVVLDGTGVGGFVHSDRLATYTPVVGPPVDITYDWQGLADNFEGAVSSNHDDVWATLDRIEALRTSRVRRCRMVWGSQSIVAQLRDVSATSADDILPGNLLHVVRFGFVQVGD